MKYSLIIIALLLAAVWSISSCKKDNPPLIRPDRIPSIDTTHQYVPCLPVCNLAPCYDADKPWFVATDSCEKLVLKYVNSNIRHLVDDSSQTFSGSINPNNPEEVVMSTISPDIEKNGTVVFNMCTGERRKLSNSIWSQPDWAEDDWIYFHKGRFEGVWRIKSDGDSLMKIPLLLSQDLILYFEVRPEHPDELVYHQRGVGVVVAKAASGKVLYQLPVMRYSTVWSADGKRLITYMRERTSSIGDIGFWNLGLASFTPIIKDIPPSNYIAGPEPNEIIWKTAGTKYKPGIYISGESSAEHKLIKETFAGNVYVLTGLSPDGSMMLAEVKEQRAMFLGLENKWFKSDHYMGFIKVDGSCELLGDFAE